MKDLTKGNIYKNFILFAIPLILSGLLNQGYNIIDSIIAGKFLGQNGLAAVGATSQAITLVSSMFWGFAAGVGVYIAKLFGAKEYNKIKCDVFNILIISNIIAIIFSALLIIFGDFIIDILNVEESIRSSAKLYYSIYLSGFFVINSSSTFVFIMNALGASAFPFYMSILSAILNVTGNILSVTVFKIGVVGIAVSSITAALIVSIMYIIKLKSCFKELGVKKQRLQINLSAFRYILSYALPTSLQQTSMYIAAFLMSPIVNAVGAAATAGYSVVMRIYHINSCIYQQSSKTLSNYASQCIGAKKYDKLHKGLFVGLIQAMVFLCPMVFVCSVFAPRINSLFFPSGYSGEALDYAVMFSRFFLPFILFNVINNLFHSFFRGIAAMKLLIIATLLGSISQIVAGYVLSNRYGIAGVYSGWVFSWIFEAVFLLIVYLIKFRNNEMLQKYIKNGL